MTLQERFNNKINKTETCWIWIASKKYDGYGYFSINGKTHMAHRVAYKLFYGEIPNSLHVCHKCDNPSCVNPFHLFLGSHDTNMKDMTKKGRQIKGERQHSAKLKTEEILEIRKLYSSQQMTQRQLANKFGVAQNIVSRIVNYLIWKHI